MLLQTLSHNYLTLDHAYIQIRYHVNTCLATAVVSEIQLYHHTVLQAYKQATNCSRNSTSPALPVESANSAVTKFGKKQLHHQDALVGSRKRTYTTSTFTDEDSTKVGQCAAKSSMARAQKHFPDLDLGESTARYICND